MIKDDVWNKRIRIATGLVVILGLILGFRLFQKQVLEHGVYATAAENQYMVKESLPSQRGQIYASDMFPLATNVQSYQVLAVPSQITNPDQVAGELAPILQMSQADIFNLINNNKNYLPPIKHGLTEEEGNKIAALKINGVTVLPEMERVYPEGQLASQVLGFVNKDGDGQYGLEGYYNDELKGDSGLLSAEKDITGRLFSIGEEINPQNGSDLVLTIDHAIQYQAEQVLAEAIKKYQADSGSIVIMDPKTGAIYAMAGNPTYDPNNYNQVPSGEQNVFNNPVIADAWEPGSVFKPLIMAAAINEGKVTPDTTQTFSNMVKVNGYEIHTATDHAYGKETMTNVLENSDNVGMVWVAQQLGKAAEAQYLTNFGFGRKTGIELNTESTGIMADVKKWSDVQAATIAFGQGISVTPIQLVTAIASIANGGHLMQPYIISEIHEAGGKVDKQSPEEVKTVLSAQTAQEVTQMMVSVVKDGQGKKAGVAGYNIAGKTGTAQIPDPSGGYYTDRQIGSFVGFAPAEDPKFVMLVRLDQPKTVAWAEDSAAPAFGEMAQWLLQYFGIAPSS